MPRHILIAVDGSEFALKAARYGLELAKALSAEATACIVTPTWAAIGLSEIARGHFEEEFAARSQAYGDDCLAKVSAVAAQVGTKCSLVQKTGDRAFVVILATAAERGCDLIVVGSHGRRGLDSVVLGSETVKILTNSRIPIVVYKE